MRQFPSASMRWTWVAVALLLVPGLARADVPSEERFVEREEIPDEARRTIIGVADLWYLLPSGTEKGFLLPVYAEADRAPGSGGPLKPQRLLPAEQTLAWSGWDFDSQALRRFPVLRKHGAYVEVLLNIRTSARGWLRVGDTGETPSTPRHKIGFVAFDEGLRGRIVNLSFFGQAWLYEEPREGAPRRRLRPDASSGGIGESGWIEVREVRGSFAQVAPTVGMDEAPAPPAGWVRIRDERGRLMLWLDTHPGC